ncbi:MAG: uracil-DNA glycosylase [Caulobacteraceae bacterium]
MAADDRSLESLLLFWKEAGVEAALAEAPVDRTLSPARRGPGVQPSSPSAISVTAGVQQTVELARKAATLARDLGELERAIGDFEGCPLREQGARQAVFARGAPEAAVMVIGEAPGGEEDLKGAPFVGRAGQLLDRMFAAAGLEGRVFITNTVYWRPPGNRTPTLAEQQVCAPFLHRSIELIGPRLLLLVGAAASTAMLGAKAGILALRGRWFSWRSGDGAVEIPALPTLHPAFLLRTPSAKKLAWSDLLLLAEKLEEFG